MVCRALCAGCRRYQQIAAATFEVQAKQQYLKQLAAEAASRQAGTGAGSDPGEAQAYAVVPPQPPLKPHTQQHSQQLPQQGQPPPGLLSQSQQQPLAAAAGSAGPPLGAGQAGGGGGAGSGGGMLRVLEGTAQEVYRALLFVVFTLEVYCMSLLPFVGGWAHGCDGPWVMGRHGRRGARGAARGGQSCRRHGHRKTSRVMLLSAQKVACVSGAQWQSQDHVSRQQGPAPTTRACECCM